MMKMEAKSDNKPKKTVSEKNNILKYFNVRNDKLIVICHHH